MSRQGKFWMVAALLGVVGMAFRVSWNALKDIASAIGADPLAAGLYPLVVDGLMALALVAALILTGADRRFALRVLGAFTAASLVLNYVHGLVPALHAGGRVRLADWAPAHYALVLLASCLPVGSIFFGSDLVAKVLHHKPEPAENDQSTANRSTPDQPEPADPTPYPSVYESADPASTPEPTPGPVEVAAVRPVRAVAAVSSRPRRATGTVPQSARTKVPTRTAEELLAEARSATVGWSEEELTAERIRTAVRTSADRARTLRDTLKAERATAASPERPAVADKDEDGAAGEESAA
ncbi:DUF2637 domain-containing protein [Kitasatospora arboriphila]|uniref:DUF2637 domain-containing protein n=1 Tax=Kitasatospora arboriphila TaxID=258052 RepID=A0ABP4E5C7_9ACTN